MSVRSWRRRHRRSERGAVLVATSFAMVAVLITAALVLDIARARSTARSLQSTADLAVLAAGPELGTGDALGACQAAMGSLAMNLPDVPAFDATAFCTQPGDDVTQTTCSPSGTNASASPTLTAGKYVITLQYPVPDAVLADGTLPGARINDGKPCERLRMVLRATDETFFAGVVGVHGLVPTRSATARAVTEDGTRVPALWLLDPTGCVALGVSGGSQVTVGSSSPVPVPGVIAIDSDGSTCNSNQVTVSASGAGTALTAEPRTGSPAGTVSLFAMRRGASSCSPPACSSDDVTNGRLTPQPRRAPARATRAPVDWRFNCKATYPAFHGVPVAACPDGTPAYIDHLAAAIGSSGRPDASYQSWKGTYGCNPSGTIVVSGNWWIDCPGGLSVGNGTSVDFRGGNVVFDSGLTMTGGQLSFNSSNPSGSLPSSCVAPTVVTPCIASSSSGASIVYVRDGDWNLTGGQLTARHTSIFLMDGYAKVNTGVPPTWLAPTEGPFATLAFWAPAASNKFSMNGGSGLDLSGVFFTPEAAPFSLAGGGTWGQQHAQFISYSLAVSGGGSVTLVPDTSAVSLPPLSAELIR